MNKQHTDMFSQTECLSLETIDQYINDQLSAGERQRVEKHLIDCELCSYALEGIAASGDMAGVATSVEVINEKIRGATQKQFFGSFQENYAKYAAVAAVVLIIFGSIFVLFKDEFKDKNELIVENLSPVQQEEESIPVDRENKAKKEAGIEKDIMTKGRDLKESDKILQKSTEVLPVQPSGPSRVTLDRKAGVSISSDMATAQEGFDLAGTVLEEETGRKDEDIEAEVETTIDDALADGEIDDLLADEAPAPEALVKEETNLLMKSDKRSKSRNRYTVAAKSKSKKRTQAGGAYAGMVPKAAKEPVVADVESDTISEILSSTAEKLADDQDVFSIVEKMPQFVGGDSALHIYLSENIKYPATAKDSGIEGTVYLTFIISSKGEVLNVKVARGIGGGCDEEAVRVVENMPDWISGKQRGKSVPVQYNLPIQFKL